MPTKLSSAVALVLTPWPALIAFPSSADHAAFIERCAEEGTRRTLAQVRAERDIDLSVLPKSALEGLMETSREMCNLHYKGIDVCADGGAEQAEVELERRIELYGRLLADSTGSVSTPLREMKLNAERELTALRSLISGRTDYCEDD